jgi:hypothetical protein
LRFELEESGGPEEDQKCDKEELSEDVNEVSVGSAAKGVSILESFLQLSREDSQLTISSQYPVLFPVSLCLMLRNNNL